MIRCLRGIENVLQLSNGFLIVVEDLDVPSNQCEYLFHISLQSGQLLCHINTDSLLINHSLVLHFLHFQKTFFNLE